MQSFRPTSYIYIFLFKYISILFNGSWKLISFSFVVSYFRYSKRFLMLRKILLSWPKQLRTNQVSWKWHTRDWRQEHIVQIWNCVVMILKIGMLILFTNTAQLSRFFSSQFSSFKQTAFTCSFNMLQYSRFLVFV